VLLRGQQSPLVLALPPERVFEDRLPRLVDLDGDGRDELILVEAHARQGASLVVYGVDHGSAGPRLVERARSEPVGTMRWLNPVGAGDFEPGAALEIAAVVTPHLGGVLTLYRYEPPRLVVLSRLPGPANHRMGSAEQQLSAVLHGRSGPLAVVPSGDYSALLVLHWVAQRGWSQAAALRLPAALERVEPRAGGACVALANGAAWQLRLR